MEFELHVNHFAFPSKLSRGFSSFMFSISNCNFSHINDDDLLNLQSEVCQRPKRKALPELPQFMLEQCSVFIFVSTEEESSRRHTASAAQSLSAIQALFLQPFNLKH